MVKLSIKASRLGTDENLMEMFILKYLPTMIFFLLLLELK